MARCGCLESAGCNCLVAGGIGTNVSGAGTLANPYVPDLEPGIGGLVPHVKTPQWHRVPHYTNTVSQAAFANRAYATPFQPGFKASGNWVITGVCAEVSSAAVSGGNLRLGIYAGAIGLDPTTSAIISDEGIQDFGGNATTTGIKRWTVNVPVAPFQLVWLVLVPQFASAGSIRGSALSGAGVAQAATPTSLADTISSYYSDTGFGGVMPATFGAVVGAIAGPLLAVQIT